MRFSAVAILAAVVAVANAQSDAYPFKDNGACVAKCLLDAGLSMDPNFTDDPTNPNFLTSLGYAHDKGTPKYTAYMTKSGTCITGCPAAELALYNEQYEKKTEWYNQKKAGATGSVSATVTATATATVTNPHGGATPTGTATATNPHGGASPTSTASSAAGLVAGSSAIVGAAVAFLGALAL